MDSHDKELLELAAKALGAKIEWRTILGKEVLRADLGNGFEPWDPADNDGDSRRLEVELRLLVKHWPAGCDATDWDNTGKTAFVRADEVGGCHFAATRRAVLLVAAEIGRSMP